MAAALPLAPTEALPLLQRKPASDVKREGWRGIMKAVDAAGRLLVTNHDEPQAVILSLSEYRALSELADSARRQQQDRLEQLTREFDDDLAVLNLQIQRIFMEAYTGIVDILKKSEKDGVAYPILERLVDN